MKTYLYTKEDCNLCTEAKTLLDSEETEYVEILINNPALELGIMTLLDNYTYVHAPVIMRPTGKVQIVGKIPNEKRYQFFNVSVKHLTEDKFNG